MATHDSGTAISAPPAVSTTLDLREPILLPLFSFPRWRGLLTCRSILFAGLALLLTNRFPNEADAASNARDDKSDPGVTHINDRIPRGPWSIHVAKIDRSRKDLAFYAPLALGKVLGVSKVSDQAVAVPREIGRALAGVNGDFYERDNRTYAGDPRGLQIVNGELVSAASTTCIWFDAEENPHVDDVTDDFKVIWPNGHQTPIGLNEQRRSGTAVLYTSTYGTSTRVNGGRDVILEKEGNGSWLPLQAGQTYRAKVRTVQTAVTNTALSPNVMVLSIGPSMLSRVPEVAPGAILQISTLTTPDLKAVKTAIAGGPALVKDGKPFSEKASPAATRAYSERSKYERHPRSAIGWNATHIFLITVDGRQPGLSVGMTLAELAEYMVKIGCTDGMNFDGGNSATMWMLGRVVNSPCVGERPVANGLFVVRKPVPE